MTEIVVAAALLALGMVALVAWLESSHPSW